MGLSGAFGNITMGQIWTAAYNHAGGWRYLNPYFGSGDTTSRQGSALSYAFNSGAASFQVDAYLDGARNTGKTVDEFQFGATINLGDIGKLGIGYRDIENEHIMVPVAGSFPTLDPGSFPTLDPGSFPTLDPGSDPMYMIEVDPDNPGSFAMYEIMQETPGSQITYSLTPSGAHKDPTYRLNETEGGMWPKVDIMFKELDVEIPETENLIINANGELLAQNPTPGETDPVSITWTEKDGTEKVTDVREPMHKVNVNTSEGAGGRNILGPDDEGGKSIDAMITAVLVADAKSPTLGSIDKDDASGKYGETGCFSADADCSEIHLFKVTYRQQDRDALVPNEEGLAVFPTVNVFLEANDMNIMHSAKATSKEDYTIKPDLDATGAKFPQYEIVKLEDGSQVMYGLTPSGARTDATYKLVETADSDGNGFPTYNIVVKEMGADASLNEDGQAPSLNNDGQAPSLNNDGVFPGAKKNPGTKYGSTESHVSLQLSLGAMTGTLGYSEIDKNDEKMDKKISFLGLNGSLGDSGLSWTAYSRSVDDHDGSDTNSWGASLTKSLGDGVSTYIDHGNDGDDGLTFVGLSVNF